MKRILILMALLLVWTGSANGGPLKVLVPIDEFERMDERLEVLENENIALKADMNALGDAEALNRQNKEMSARLNDLESENNKLQSDLAAIQGTDSATAQQKMESQISSLEKKNARLKRNIKKLKDEGVIYASDRRVARTVYFNARKASSDHVFK